MNYVIIGAGVTGIHAAENIRRLDPQSNITMIGDEPPYCRPMISLVLEGAIPPEKLSITSFDFFDKFTIKPLFGHRITQIDTDNRQVVVDKNSEKLCFDKLLIATGADPRPVKAQGTGLKNIFFMRTQAHVRAMLESLPDAKRALVLGGGLVGFKAAYGLLHRGLDVTMVIGSGYPLSMQADDIAGKMISDELIRHGLKVKIGAEVRAFEGNGSVKQAYLSDGTVLNCDMVVIGKGVLPALSFLPQDKIRTDLGIVVNEFMETNIPGIYAAGDAAQTFDIARKSTWVNALWPEAVNQGRIAGMNMAGRAITYKGSLSRNVIRIFDTDVMTGGIVNPPDNSGYEILSHIDHRRGTYRKLVFREDVLVGMVLVNHIEQGGILLSLIQHELPIKISKEALIEPSFNVKVLMS